MDTYIVKDDYINPDENIINKAASILQQGGLVAFPTETVYGLGGNGLDPVVCKKIYIAKGRPSDNPLILHISNINDLNKIVQQILDGNNIITVIFQQGSSINFNLIIERL